MNFDSRISEMNQLNNDHQQMLNNSSTPSNSLFDGHLQKYPISPMMNASYGSVRDDTMRNSFEMWKMEMDRKVRAVEGHARADRYLMLRVYFTRSLYPRSNVMTH